MTNKEKYGNEIIELAVNTGMFCIKNGEPVLCEETERKDCDFHESDSCKGSTYNFREWLNSEYVEPPVDWTKVPVNTPILVRNSEEERGEKDILQNMSMKRCMRGQEEQHHGACLTSSKIYSIGKWKSWQKVRNSMGGNVVSNLCSLPATDLNFTSELNRATAYQIKQAIETMKQNGGKNKGRIKACDRELENRRLTKKDKHGKYVSKEHLSILCNTFSSEHRLKAILNKLGEYEDAERQGLLLQLPCKEARSRGDEE